MSARKSRGTGLPFIPFEKWDVFHANYPPVPIHDKLVRFKSTGRRYSESVMLDDDSTRLLWAEPVTEGIIAAWHDVSPGGYVGLVDSAYCVLRGKFIPVRAAPLRVRDAYLWTYAVCIKSAVRAVALLRDRQADSDSEAWLRRQLDGLDRGEAMNRPTEDGA